MSAGLNHLELPIAFYKPRSAVYVAVATGLLGRAFVKSVLGGQRFTDVTLEVTSGQLQVQELGWNLKRAKKSRR